MPKRQVSKQAYEPAWWRQRIAKAVEPHGRLKAIADAAKMSSPQLQKIANGTTEDPGVATLARIAKAMQSTLVELLAEPRPEGDSGHGSAGERNPILDERFAGLLADLDTEAPAADSWRGDVLKAIAALNRALRRDDPGEADEGPSKARR